VRTADAEAPRAVPGAALAAIDRVTPEDPPRELLVEPRSFFDSAVPPSSCVSSARAGWDGALFAAATAARSGADRVDHRTVMIQRWLTPMCVRSADGGGWTTHAPGVRLRFPGDAQPGSWRGPTDLELLFVTPARIEAVLGGPWERSGLQRWREPTRELPLVGEVLSAMAQDVEEGHPAGPLTGDALVIALLTHLDGRGNAPRSPGPRALGRRLELVLEYIEANLTLPLTMAELAGVACVRSRRLHDAFVARTGWSPHRYVVARRVERAKALMSDPALTLGEIARAVGFGDASQFSKVFRRYAGEPPGVYRRR
jgi:AraC-like DNA-binding protein